MLENSMKAAHTASSPCCRQPSALRCACDSFGGNRGSSLGGRNISRKQNTYFYLLQELLKDCKCCLPFKREGPLDNAAQDHP